MIIQWLFSLLLSLISQSVQNLGGEELRHYWFDSFKAQQIDKPEAFTFKVFVAI